VARTLTYEPITKKEALALTDRIKCALMEYIDGIVEAWNRHADESLGFETWEAYVQANFPSVPRFEIGERTSLAKRLVEEEGMTVRQVGATLDISKSTVSNDLNGVDSRGRRIVEREYPRLLTDADWSHAVDMAEAGNTFATIASELGVNESTIRRDARVREARLRSGNSVLEGSHAMNSFAHEERTIACALLPAPEVIRSIELDISHLLGRNYTLNKRDLNKIRTVLTDGLAKVEGYSNG